MADIPVPPSLDKLQLAFGKSIATEFVFLDDEGDYRTQPEHYAPYALSLMVEGHGLSGSERLGTYNEQYWFRLMDVMAEELPLLTHLIGRSDMNRLASAYVTAYPSGSPSLRHLTRHLDQFLAQDHDWNMLVLQQAARLDMMYADAFDAALLAPLRLEAFTPEEMQAALTAPLKFQPHWHLYQEDYNLVETRPHAMALNEESDTEADIKEQAGHWAIYRQPTRIATEALGPIQYHILSALADDTPLGPAIETVAQTLDPEDIQFLSENIQSWFGHWASLGWFVQPNP